MAGPEREAVDRIRALAGVRRVDLLSPHDRESLAGLRTPASAENEGVAEVLARTHAACLFKDSSFRPPPDPTVLLVDRDGTVLGLELVNGRAAPADGRRYAYLGKDFLLLPGVKPQGGMRFVLPPVRFPELEGMRGISRPVSGSPDTPQDEYLRSRFRVATGNDLASILVGFDVRKP